MEYAILKGKKVIPIDNVLEWAKAFETMDRHVDTTQLPNKRIVSTVFLGTNYRFGKGKPIWFETMVFTGIPKTVALMGEKIEIRLGDELDMEQYETWTQAVRGHKRMVKKWSDELSNKGV